MKTDDALVTIIRLSRFNKVLTIFSCLKRYFFVQMLWLISRMAYYLLDSWSLSFLCSADEEKGTQLNVFFNTTHLDVVLFFGYCFSVVCVIVDSRDK